MDVKAARDAALAYAAKDLAEVIAVQEATLRAGGGPCAKLGAYYDELYAVRTEQQRRAAAAKKTTKTRAAVAA